MNVKSIILLATLSAAASIAFAQERVPDADTPTFVSTKTRAEVRAELEQARRDGSLQALHSENYMPVFSSVRSRDEVRAEASQQRQRRVFDTTTPYDNRG